MGFSEVRIVSERTFYAAAAAGGWRNFWHKWMRLGPARSLAHSVISDVSLCGGNIVCHERQREKKSVAQQQQELLQLSLDMLPQKKNRDNGRGRQIKEVACHEG